MRLCWLLCLATLLGPAWAEQRLQPYIQARILPGTLDSAEAWLRQRLQAAQFAVLDRSEPCPGGRVLSTSSPDWQQALADQDLGPAAVLLPLGLKQSAAGVVLSYPQPAFLLAAYALEADARPLARQLAQALGAEQAIGPEYSASALRDFRAGLGLEMRGDGPLFRGGPATAQAEPSLILEDGRRLRWLSPPEGAAGVECRHWQLQAAALPLPILAWTEGALWRSLHPRWQWTLWAPQPYSWAEALGLGAAADARMDWMREQLGPPPFAF